MERKSHDDEERRQNLFHFCEPFQKKGWKITPSSVSTGTHVYELWWQSAQAALLERASSNSPPKVLITQRAETLTPAWELTSPSGRVKVQVTPIGYTVYRTYNNERWYSQDLTPHNSALLSDGKSVLFFWEKKRNLATGLEQKQAICRRILGTDDTFGVTTSWTWESPRNRSLGRWHLSSDEKILWQWLSCGGVVALDAETGKVLWEALGDTDYPPESALSGNEQRLAMRYSSFRLSLRKAETGEEVSLPLVGKVFSFLLSPDSRWLGASTKERFHLLHAETGSEAWSSTVTPFGPKPLFSPDGERVVLQTESANGKRQFSLFNAETGEKISEFPLHSDKAEFLFLPHSKILILTDDNKVTGFSAETGEWKWELPLSASAKLAFFVENKQLTVYDPKTVFAVNLKTGNKTWGEKTWTVPPINFKYDRETDKFENIFSTWPPDCKYSADGKLLLVQNRKRISILDATTGDELWGIVRYNRIETQFGRHHFYPDGRIRVQSNSGKYTFQLASISRTSVP